MNEAKNFFASQSFSFIIGMIAGVALVFILAWDKVLY